MAFLRLALITDADLSASPAFPYPVPKCGTGVARERCDAGVTTRNDEGEADTNKLPSLAGIEPTNQKVGVIA
jgi:hypothetical protein